MDISILRDLVIVIGGFLLLVVIILAGIFGVLLYRDIKSLISTTKITIDTAKQLGNNFQQALNIFKIITCMFKQEEKTKVESKPSGSPTK